GAHNDRADSRAPRPGRRAGRSGVSGPCAAPGRVLVLTALHCRAAAPGTGGSWLAAGCASISRWNAKIRPTHHARSRRLGADVGARRTAPPGSTAPRQLTYGPLYALSAHALPQTVRVVPALSARQASQAQVLDVDVLIQAVARSLAPVA